jgi:hypothetical protein
MPATVQMPNLALVETKRITVYREAYAYCVVILLLTNFEFAARQINCVNNEDGGL